MIAHSGFDCISRISSDAEHVFKYLLASLLSLEKYSHLLSTFNWIVCLFLLFSCESSLCISAIVETEILKAFLSKTEFGDRLDRR